MLSSKTSNHMPNQIEVIPGPEQKRLEAGTSAAIHALIARNDKLTRALSEIIMEVDIMPLHRDPWVSCSKIQQIARESLL